jgi:hypothetical protein
VCQRPCVHSYKNNKHTTCIVHGYAAKYETVHYQTAKFPHNTSTTSQVQHVNTVWYVLGIQTLTKRLLVLPNAFHFKVISSAETGKRIYGDGWGHNNQQQLECKRQRLFTTTTDTIAPFHDRNIYWPIVNLPAVSPSWNLLTFTLFCTLSLIVLFA